MLFDALRVDFLLHPILILVAVGGGKQVDVFFAKLAIVSLMCED
jgi:hypothetical protein